MVTETTRDGVLIIGGMAVVATLASIDMPSDGIVGLLTASLRLLPSATTALGLSIYAVATLTLLFANAYLNGGLPYLAVETEEVDG